MKTTHDSGSYIIVDGSRKENPKEINEKLNKSLNKNFYYMSREWPYKNIKPRIICEMLLEDINNGEIMDYRFFCFHGEPKFITVDISITDKKKVRRNLYSLDWELMDEEISYDRELKKKLTKPKNLDEMIRIAKILSKDFKHVRVDLYNVNDKIYFGELTFYHQAGYGDIRPKEFNEQMGDWIYLDSR